MTTKTRRSSAKQAVILASVAGLLMVGGCNNGAQFPDSVQSVNTALEQNNLSNIRVHEDRYKGVVTLTGTVATDEQKVQAQSVAMESAATYQVQNDITVESRR